MQNTTKSLVSTVDMEPVSPTATVTVGSHTSATINIGASNPAPLVLRARSTSTCGVGVAGVVVWRV